MDTSSKATARIPQVDRLLRHPRLEAELSRVRREVLVELIRRELGRLRERLALGEALPEIDRIAESVALAVERLLAPGLKRLINATGVILNTNLGRAPLPDIALENLRCAAQSYCNLEVDLVSGKRGERSQKIEDLLRLLTGCRSALVVNNNAAAVLLAVNALARNRQVIVSRGELVEIGGSFRLPEVIVAAGGVLTEVGTTNRTRVADFRKAISGETGLLLKCHRSNFEIRGFTEEASVEELVALSREAGIPFVEDLGSGALVDLSPLGFEDEPTVQSQLQAGCELVTFSGDKLLGGPQAGIVVGKGETVERLRKSPLYRALRPDKLTLAALEAVLIEYLSPAPEAGIPALRMAFAPAGEVRARAEAFARLANRRLRKMRCTVSPCRATAGGGSLPGKTLASFAVALACPAKPNQLAAMLRLARPPVFAFVQEDEVLLDLRTVAPAEEAELLEVLFTIDATL